MGSWSKQLPYQFLPYLVKVTPCKKLYLAELNISKKNINASGSDVPLFPSPFSFLALACLVNPQFTFSLHFENKSRS